MLLTVLTMSVPLVSCSDNDDDEPDGPGGVSMAVEEQKLQLEATANELMGKINANDFKNITDLFQYVDEKTNDDSAVDNWFDAAKEACKQSVSDESVKYLYKASNFYGQFELRDGRWVKTGTGSNLKFSFMDAGGRSCSVTVECSGKDTPVHHEEFDDEEWSYGYANCMRYENAYAIPENITVTLVQGGSTLASVTVSTQLDISASSGEVDLAHDRATLTSTLVVNSYTVKIERAAFGGGRNATASASATMSKGGEVLITMKMQGAGNTSDVDDVKVGRVSFNMDVLGQVQLGGIISDVSALSDCLDEADENYTNEKVYRACIEEANKLIDVNLYFNGNSESVAYVKYYVFEEEDWFSARWTREPVVMFHDGTAYTTFESYFDEITFDSVINRFNDLLDDFTRLVE